MNLDTQIKKEQKRSKVLKKLFDIKRLPTYYAKYVIDRSYGTKKYYVNAIPCTSKYFYKKKK